MYAMLKKHRPNKAGSRRSTLIPGSRLWGGSAIAGITLLFVLLQPGYTDAGTEASSLTGMDTGGRAMVSAQTIRGHAANLSDWDYVGRWGSSSDVAVAVDAVGSRTFDCRAAPKGRRVGKAYVTKNFPAVLRGQIVEAQATYRIIDAPTDGSLYLMDFECRHCGHKHKAGIRVLFRDGRIRVNRTKLGLSNDFISKPVPQIRVGEPFTLTVRLELGARNGQTTVLVNGETVVDRTGINMPLQRIAKQFGIKIKQEQLDYVQFGITANGSRASTRLMLSDAAIRTFR